MERGTRRRLAMALGGVLAAAVVVYGIVIFENVSKLRKAHAACSRLLASTSQNMTRMQPLFRLMFDNPKAVEQDTVLGTDNLCTSVEARLAWWHWNWGVDFSPPVNSARDTRLRKALDTAIERCPKLEKKIGSKPPLAKNPRAKEAIERQICQAYKNARSRLDQPRPHLPIWRWPERLEKLADAAERGNGKPPHSLQRSGS